MAEMHQEPHMQPGSTTPEKWYTLSSMDAANRLGVEVQHGLNDQEVRTRLARYGPNLLYEERPLSFWRVFLKEVREPMILLLLVTGFLYALWGALSDALTIFAIILILVGAEVSNEYRAKKALAALGKLAEPRTPVRRNGRYQEIPVEQVVPGDVLFLQAGRRVPADARLLESASLEADEAPLTGESLPVEKESALILPPKTTLAERRNLVFAGTTITRGRATVLVVATGMQSELGHVAGLARAVHAPRTPLQQSMRDLTRWLVWFALGVSIIVPVLGSWLGGQSFQQMVLTGLSLAFASIPEELPILITIVLALGGYRLSQQHAIVKRLQAVEILGSITSIATDKTGTLTQNRMEVRQCSPDTYKNRLLALGVLCTSAAENGTNPVGDPVDVALLRGAREAGMDIQALRYHALLHDEFTFDTLRKRMAVVYQINEMFHVVVKGAPEAILARSTRRLVDDREQMLAQADREAVGETATHLAARSLRVIALAEKRVPAAVHITQDEAESDLTFVGLIGFLDPPRPEVKEAIAACRAAGVRPIMITGDHPLTARTIAEQIGLDGKMDLLTGAELDALSDEALQEAVSNVSVYARTTPEQKLRIVQALHARGERVAVTGDGINDAPALAAADIGVAMGETGTDVAREAADMVLADDNFTTIVRAMQEGRILFANLKKGVRYYLSCKVALIAASLLPVLLRIPIPFAPVQIILMELFMDLAASVTFVNEPAESDLMHLPPRDPQTPFMDRAMVSGILTSAVGLFAAVSLAYLLTWFAGGGIIQAQTVAFVTWLLGHVLLAMNMRSEREPLFRLGFFSNRLMVIWSCATLIFILFAVFVPGVQTLLRTVMLTGREWLLVISAALLGTFWMEVRKLFFFRR